MVFGKCGLASSGKSTVATIMARKLGLSSSASMQSTVNVDRVVARE
jgi:cytidylate kinase